MRRSSPFQTLQKLPVQKATEPANNVVPIGHLEHTLLLHFSEGPRCTENYFPGPPQMPDDPPPLLQICFAVLDSDIFRPLPNVVRVIELSERV